MRIHGEEREALARQLEPFHEQRRAGLAHTLLIDVAVGGRKVCLAAPTTPREPNPRQAAALRRRAQHA